MERYTIALVCCVDNLGAESRADELRAGFVGDGFQQGGHSGSVLGVQVGVDLVKDDHGTAFCLLEGKDETQRAKT